MKGKIKKAMALFLLCIGMSCMLVACSKTEPAEDAVVTETPEVTEAPEATETPEATEVPAATSTPAPTKTPKPTKAPVVVSEVEDMKVSSPDGKTEVQFWSDTEGVWYYSLTDGEQPIIGKSRIGMELKEGSLYKGLSLSEGSLMTKEIKETYELFTGYNALMENFCNEMTFVLENEQGSFRFEVRVHNDGIGYRYTDVTAGSADAVTVLDEISEVALQQDCTSWAFGLNGTYEGTFVKRDYSQLRGLSQKLCTPMLVKTGDYWMLLTEAAALNNNGEFCTSALQTKPGSVTLNWAFGLRRDPAKESKGEVDSPGHLEIKSVETVNGFTTPWRAVVISEDMNEFINTSLIADLNPTADEELFEDVSYIKPGKVAWNWWSEGSATKDYNKQIEYIDFAAENGWEHICMDADWRNFEHRLAEICQYAKDKGVGIFVWVNYRDLKDKASMESLIAKWKAAGVVGLKTDYFESDEPSVLQVMQNVAECCAKNQLMVLYHGCIRPGGECRTYPNILSTEAVLGEEFHKWSTDPTVRNCLMYPFTRNLCGSMDYTPTGVKVDNEATYGFCLAQTIVYESALQHFAYAASAYKNYNGLALLNHIPTEWDETRFIEGFPGENITIARRNGENWFVGSMTDAERTVEFALDFLGEGTYNAYIYENRADGTGLARRELKVKKGDKVTLELCKGGGAAMMFTKGTIDTSVGENEEMNPEGYTYYEAESPVNLLAGEAKGASSAFCSGGQKVGYVGQKGNTLTFPNVKAEKSGTYCLLVYYCSGENRTFTLTVNGEDRYDLTKLNSGDYVHPAVAAVTVDLKAGNNFIVFGNDAAYAPDLDRIAVSDKLVSELDLSDYADILYKDAKIATAEKDPDFCENPIVRSMYTADPAPMVYGDTLYLYVSHDENQLVNDFYTMLDWYCYSTKDMVNWTDHGKVFSLEDIAWADDRAWAPQAVERNGKFYIYCPVHKKNGGMAIAVGVSDSPTGPFKDIGAPLVNEGDWNDIDPTVFIDADGQTYLYFGNPELRYVLLNEDMVSYNKEVGVVKVPMTTESFGTGGQSTGTTYAEGPWFYKRDGIYYMVYAAFAKGQGSEHLAYSTSDSPTGPWVYRGVLMDEKGGTFTNHPGVIDFKGHSYLFYHTQELPGGNLFHRSVCVAEFTYNEDGTIDKVEKSDGVKKIK